LNTGYWYTPVKRLQFRILNLGTTRVMANSKEAKRIAVAVERISPERVDVVYQGVDMNVFRPGAGDPKACEQLGIPASARVVGIVANLRPVKDLPLFLRAASVVSREVSDVVFLIIGRGAQLQELQQLARECLIEDRVYFTNGQGAVTDYLARMSIGCLTSLSEGFSNAILEYMAAGLPVVATDVGGNREAIVDGETGFLVEERNPEALARPILRLLRNDAEREEMGRRGLERCAQHFEWGRTILSLEEYYTSLM
jgi:glycosyltransferase involved in cell wall biosynthesis